ISPSSGTSRSCIRSSSRWRPWGGRGDNGPRAPPETGRSRRREYGQVEYICDLRPSSGFQHRGGPGRALPAGPPPVILKIVRASNGHPSPEAPAPAPPAPPALTAGRVRPYEEQASLVVRRLSPPARMAEARKEAEALLARRDLIAVENLRCRWQPNVQTGACCEFETFDPVIDLSPVCDRLAHDPRLLAGLAALFRGGGVPVQGQTHFQAAGAEGLRPAPGLDRLARLPAQLRDGPRPVRPRRRRQRLHRGVRRLPPGRQPLARGRRLPRAPPGGGRRVALLPDGTGPRRRRDLRRLHAPPLGPQPLRPLAAAALPEL